MKIDRGRKKESDRLGRDSRPGDMEGGRRGEERKKSGTETGGAGVTELVEKFRKTDFKWEIVNKEEVSIFKNNKSPVTKQFGRVGERREVGRVERQGTAPSRRREGSEKEDLRRSEPEEKKDNWLR